MSGRRARRADETQLVLDLDGPLHPAVEHSRAYRRAAGLPESLTDAETLACVVRVLDAEAPSGASARRQPERDQKAS